MLDFTIEVEVKSRNDELMEITVEYDVYGTYRRQTMEEPAEYPEIEIGKITALTETEEIELDYSCFSASAWKEICDGADHALKEYQNDAWDRD